MTATSNHRSIQSTLWRSFFGVLEQKKKLIQMNEDDNVELEKELKILQRVASAEKEKAESHSEKKRKNQSSAEGSRKKKRKDEEDILNGDDVPLVEEAVGDLLDDEDGDHHAALGVNGDNFMHTVIKMNRAQNGATVNEDDEGVFAQKLRSSFGLEKAKKASKKKLKVDNGLGVVTVDEELVLKKTPNKKSSDPGSIEEGRKCFEWMIHPEKPDNFFANIWEKRPMHIKRRNQYFKHVFSTKSFDEILKHQNVQFSKNLDVTSYTDGQRETHNPEGRAYAPVVWDLYNNGCSLRMLNPQTFDDQVWKLCATLQDFMGSFVGTNMYLTPPGTQGFAPHYDDVEVFIMQLEGKKRWRLYQPRCAQETLPRFSSPNFSQEEIGEPMMDIVLESGDLLYMPRGTIHQGNCMEDAHSLHITVSCHQLNTYGDLLEHILPAALKSAMAEDIDFRKGLPTNYLQKLGVAHSDVESKVREDFMSKVKNLMGKLFTFANVDGAVDQMGKKFMHTSLPPFLTSAEATRCVQAGGERWNASKNRVVNRVEIDPDTEIRLIRANCLRLVVDNDNLIKIYFNVENTREYQEIEPQFLEVDSDTAPAIEALIKRYPQFIKVENLPIQELDLKMKVVQDLWEKKLLMTKSPLEAHYDD